MRDCCMTRCRARACSDIVAVHPAPRNAAQRLLVQLARVRPLNRGRVHVLVTSLFCICIFIVFLVGAASARDRGLGRGGANRRRRVRHRRRTLVPVPCWRVCRAGGKHGDPTCRNLDLTDLIGSWRKVYIVPGTGLVQKCKSTELYKSPPNGQPKSTRPPHAPRPGHSGSTSATPTCTGTCLSRIVLSSSSCIISCAVCVEVTFDDLFERAERGGVAGVRSPPATSACNRGREHCAGDAARPAPRAVVIGTHCASSLLPV